PAPPAKMPLRAEIEWPRFYRCSRERPQDRLDFDVGEYAFDLVRIVRSPLLGRFERLELGDQQASAEPCGPRIGAIERGMRASENQPPVSKQRLYVLEM